MCGIFCVLNSFCNNCDNLVNQLKFEKNIKRRGPDSFNFSVFGTKECNLAFASSVLWLQGQNLTPQPLEDNDCIFLYNGDIFDGLDEKLQKDVGDTQLFLNLLKQYIREEKLEELHNIYGPYAFIFFDKFSKKLYFARDIFGRRSLLLGKNLEGDTLILTSVAKQKTDFEFIEVPSVGVFCFDILRHKFEIHFWQNQNKNFFSKLNEFESFLKTDIASLKPHSDIPLNVTFNFEEDETLKLLKTVTTMNENIFELLLNCQAWKENILTLKILLEHAVCKRISTQPEYCKTCIKNRNKCNHATTGILFSGGVDCAVLAFICDKYVKKSRPIDLINVSFDENTNFQSPDRLTGIQTLEELQKCLPERHWNFVEVNVPKNTLNEERSSHISELIYPLNTVLDDSLGCALWFASKGHGETYTSPCRVLIVGMGADELFGGYTRHRAALKRSSLKGLQESLDEDWQNLPYRNLGRDDRVISDHGRQLRTPYLDENVVRFARGLKCWEKTYPCDTLPQGVGEKLLLRTLAYSLGLKNASNLKKRALQFGSRIANSKENAHDISSRLIF